MRLITSNLHPTFSRLARTVVLALSLFDTFVAALPTAQESGLVRRELKSYELQLFCYRGDGQENRAERVLCLEFVGLGQVCSPHDLEDRWLRMQSLTIPPTVGVVHIASHSNEYIFLHLRETLSEAAECDLKEVEDERRLWKCVDHVVDVLSQTSAGLQEAEPQHVVSDAIKKTWEGHDRPIAFLRVLSYKSKEKKIGSFEVLIDGKVMDFTPRLNGHTKGLAVKNRKAVTMYSVYVYSGHRQATLDAAIIGSYSTASIWDKIPTWVEEVQEEFELPTVPEYSLGLIQVDKFITEMAKTMRLADYYDLDEHGWKKVRVEELRLTVQQRVKESIARQKNKKGSRTTWALSLG